MIRKVMVLVLFMILIVSVSAEVQIGGLGAKSLRAGTETQQTQPENCQNEQTCKEIDEVWANLLGKIVRGSAKVWDTVKKDWRDLKETKPAVVGGATGAATGIITKQPSTIGKNTDSTLQKACTADSLKCVIPPENVGKIEKSGIGNCPQGMVQVGNVCIDQYEAMLVDKSTGEVWSPYCNPGNEIDRLRAVSIAGVIPQSTINQIEAKKACANAGKQLCTADQWRNVCQGSDGSTYPYGNQLQTGLCNDQSVAKPYSHPTIEVVNQFCPTWKKYTSPSADGKTYVTQSPWMIHPATNQLDGTLDPTGSNSQCQTEQVYDLVGNLAEWVADIKSCTTEGGKTYTCGPLLGGHYARTESGDTGNDGCKYTTSIHGISYTDYSIGFRCCADVGATGVSAPTTTSSNSIKQALVKVAQEEWEKWGKGATKETDPTMKKYIEDNYFGSTPRCVGLDPVDTAWSAAFISFAAKKAGISDFPYDCAHTNYFQSIQEGKPVFFPKNENKGNPLTCKTYPMSERNKVQVGDIVCRCRWDENRDKNRDKNTEGCLVDYNGVWGNSHCDLVVGKNGLNLDVIGGNVLNNVERRTLDFSKDVGIANKWFGFISCGGSVDSSSTSSSSSSTAESSSSRPGTFAGLTYQDTTHLQLLIEEAKWQGIEPCYALTAVYEESKGKADAVGTDANVPSCLVPARRKLLMKTSSNCQNIYNSSTELKNACSQNRDLTYSRYVRPKSGVNSCLDDLLNTQKYRLDKTTKENFCNGNFDKDFTYGIGLGQFTPTFGSTSVTVGGVSYTHCDLFDPHKNIVATVTHLKNNGAESAGDDDKVLSVFAGYGGVSKSYPGLQARLKSFRTCESNYS